MAHSKSSVSASYIALIAVGSFLLAIVFVIISELLVRELDSIALSFVVLLIIISIGIVFDTFGTAAAAAHEIPFHAMAAKRVLGAHQAVYLVRNADRVANIANDVVGDIAGTVSGALGISIIAQIALYDQGLDTFVLSIVVVASAASLTISGKALGKKIALTHANGIIFFAAKNMARLEKLVGRDPFRKIRRS